MKPSNGTQWTTGWGARRVAPLAAAVALLCASASIPAPAQAQHHHVTVTHHDHGGGRHYDRWSGPRFRFGLSGIGGGFVGAVHGAAGGVALRAGVQISDVVAIYYQGQALLGSFVPFDPAPFNGRAAGFAFNALMIDLTFFDMLQFGAGPSLDFVWGCSSENRGAICARQGPFFGGDFRAAVIFGGGHGPGRRGGVVLSLDAHPTWLDSDAAVMLLFGIGGELY